MLRNFKKYFPLAALACSVLALVMIFLPTCSLWGTKYSGLQIMFGDSGEGLGFSIMNILVYVVALAGGALAFLGAKSNNKIIKLAAIGCFVLAIILFFCAKNFVQFSDSWSGDSGSEIRGYIKYKIGTYLSALFCLAGAAITAADVVVQ